MADRTYGVAKVEIALVKKGQKKFSPLSNARSLTWNQALTTAQRRQRRYRKNTNIEFFVINVQGQACDQYAARRAELYQEGLCEIRQAARQRSK